MPKISDVTVVSKVEQALRDAQVSGQDFMNTAMLVLATGEDKRHVLRSLHHLLKHRAIMLVVENDGRAWYAALPPEYDTRIRKMQERAVEPEGNRSNRPRKPRADKGTTRKSRNKHS